jgi:hypothetical protein
MCEEEIEVDCNATCTLNFTAGRAGAQDLHESCTNLARVFKTKASYRQVTGNFGRKGDLNGKKGVCEEHREGETEGKAIS